MKDAQTSKIVVRSSPNEGGDVLEVGDVNRLAHVPDGELRNTAVDPAVREVLRGVLGLDLHDRHGRAELVEAPGVHVFDGLEDGARIHWMPAQLLGKRAAPQEVDVVVN
eukprot:4877902-Lingulodinium_polyedra.AAC.1